MLNIRAIVESIFLTPNVKKIFNHLRQMFIKVQIVQNFDSKSYIKIEINASSYVIGRAISELNPKSNAQLNNSNLNKPNFGQWHYVVYFSKK